MSGIDLTGGCHCGAVRFRFTLPAVEVDLLDVQLFRISAPDRAA
jgi:hypothetical protein